MMGAEDIFNASRIAIDVNENAAVLITMPAPASIASWIQSMIFASLFYWRNSTGTPLASSRHCDSICASVVVP